MFDMMLHVIGTAVENMNLTFVQPPVMSIGRHDQPNQGSLSRMHFPTVLPTYYNPSNKNQTILLRTLCSM